MGTAPQANYRPWEDRDLTAPLDNEYQLVPYEQANPSRPEDIEDYDMSDDTYESKSSHERQAQGTACIVADSLFQCQRFNEPSTKRLLSAEMRKSSMATKTHVPVLGPALANLSETGVSTTISTSKANLPSWTMEQRACRTTRSMVISRIQRTRKIIKRILVREFSMGVSDPQWRGKIGLETRERRKGNRGSRQGKIKSSRG